MTEAATFFFGALTLMTRSGWPALSAVVEISVSWSTLYKNWVAIHADEAVCGDLDEKGNHPRGCLGVDVRTESKWGENVRLPPKESVRRLILVEKADRDVLDMYLGLRERPVR